MSSPRSQQVRSFALRLLGNREDWRIHSPLRPQLPSLGISWIGPILVAISTLAGWFALSDAVGKEGDVGFSLFIGSVSIVLMSWSNLLSVRFKWLEPLFGGLDKMYRWHRWLGVLSIGAMWLHIENVDDVKGIPGASRNVADTAEDLAETGSNILYVLVAISLLRWIPSKYWRLSHKLLVVPYAIACWHFWTATKPYSNSSGWGIWFAALMLIGLTSWVIRVVWRDMFRRGYEHRVVSVSRLSGTVTVELEPLDQALNFNKGQFVFLKWRQKGRTEPHPFTIASSPTEPFLRFVVRALGDWTQKFVDGVAVGDRIFIEGPYGRMRPIPEANHDMVIWVAGGVGITPFLGAALEHDPAQYPKPILFYCIRSREDAPGMPMLMKAASEDRIDLRIYASAEGSRLRPSDIGEIFGADGLRHAHVAMCGPNSLVRNILPALRNAGAPRVHLEAFDIRTGIGPDLSREIEDLIDAIPSRNT